MAGTPPWSYPDNPSGDPIDLPSNVDVAVVGAGLTGLATGLAIAETGASVAIFDSGRIGGGATRHGLGVIAAHYPGGPHHLMRRVGSGKATALWVAAGDAITLLAKNLDLTPATIRTIAGGNRARERIAWDAAWLDDRGFPASTTGNGEFLEALGWVADPLAIATALAERFEAAGGRLCEHVAVTSVSRHTNGYQLLTDSGKTSAEAVVIAAGPQPQAPGVPNATGSIQPVDRYGVSLRIDDATAVFSGADVLRAGPLTVRRLGHQRLIAAGHRGFPQGRSPEAGAEALVRQLAKSVGASGIRIEHAWTSTTGLTVDRVPHVWRHDGIWFGGGYNGDAPVPAIALGTQLGEVIGGVRTETVFAGAAPPPHISSRSSRLRPILERIRRG